MASAAVQSPPSHVSNFTPYTAQQNEDLPKTKPAGRSVSSEVHYHKDDGRPIPPSIVGRPETYLLRPIVTQQIIVNDVRGKEDEYTLDGNGFQFIRHTSAEKNFLDEEKIKQEYYPEVEQILRSVTGATKVFIFDHTIRRTPEGKHQGEDDGLRGPVQRVHIDQSYNAGPGRVRLHFPDPAEHERLLRGRYQVINLWRPIKTIRKDPLGVVEANSVPDSDLIGAPLVYPDRVGETFAVMPNPEHKWFYLHEQTPEEPLLIKCFDSLEDGRARRVPHSSFVDKEYENAESRESIEVRALVFHEVDE